MRARVSERLGDRDRVRLGLPLSRRVSYVQLKRAIDILVVLLCAPVALLLVAGCGVAILLTMGRPVFFVQSWTGLGGRVFPMYKLRTMQQQSSSPHVLATSRNDPRITSTGRFLRLSHLDELPQLWNILKGDMTLIGPRPEQPELVEVYRSSLADYDLRHSVMPGLTGWAQVYYGYAADLQETHDKLAFDLYYVQNIGPAIDLKILARTFMIYSNPNYVR